MRARDIQITRGIGRQSVRVEQRRRYCRNAVKILVADSTAGVSRDLAVHPQAVHSAHGHKTKVGVPDGICRQPGDGRKAKLSACYVCSFCTSNSFDRRSWQPLSLGSGGGS